MRNSFMRTAIQLAVENARSGQGGPFAAVVVKDGKIIARGTNRVVRANDPTSHAEINAIREACRVTGNFQLSGCEIYTNCEPCPMCLGAIYWARLKRVYFAVKSSVAAAAGFDDAFIYAELKSPKRKRKVPLKQVRCKAALEPFHAWEKKTDRVAY
jgi:guanine deaminase